MAESFRRVFGDRGRRGSAAFRTLLPDPMVASGLGYDPHPEVTRWQGNWLPPCYHPLPRTSVSERIALSVWWNGPAWTVLRNASFFLWRTWDYATPGQLDYVLDHVSEEAWRRAVEDAVPGEVSRGATMLWALRLDMIALDDYVDWPDTAHIRDYRPLAGLTRAQFLERARRWPAEVQQRAAFDTKGRVDQNTAPRTETGPVHEWGVAKR